jgi:diaminopimelate decarboxylase
VRGEPRANACYDVVGPICETGDTFAVARDLPACVPGDLLMITGAGAYGAAMASTYNSRPLLAEVLVDGDRYALIRRRQSYEEMMSLDRVATVWHTP